MELSNLAPKITNNKLFLNCSKFSTLQHQNVQNREGTRNPKVKSYILNHQISKSKNKNYMNRCAAHVVDKLHKHSLIIFRTSHPKIVDPLDLLCFVK